MSITNDTNTVGEYIELGNKLRTEHMRLHPDTNERKCFIKVTPREVELLLEAIRRYENKTY